MRLVRCHREMEVERAARAGRLSDDAQDHVRQCATCAELVRVSGWMRDLARMPYARALPDPAELWWKAQLVRRWDAERRAAAPIEAMQRVETGAGFGALAVLVYFLWPPVAQWLSRVSVPWPGLTDLAARPASAAVTIVALGGFLLALVTMLVVTDWVFDE